MSTSRVKFVLIFLACAFAFIFATDGILDQASESFLGSDSQAAWQSTLSTILSPIKIILIGPLLPFINLLHQEPDTPPPFFLALFAIYWTVLAMIIHMVAGKLKQAPRQSAQ